ncbi:MAG TPA: translocation/assembly module TamB domain-containing protein [Verrucomicrobiae bacterium]|nr:translocation/assembly module TamB domain-containing protein [Verrucomicrobiae bacterium]
MRGKRAQRLLRVVLLVLVLLIIVTVSTPIWFPWLLRPVAKRFGVTFGSYERIGYAEFAVRDAVYSNRNVRVRAGRLSIDPLGHSAEAEDWSVIVTPSDRPSTNTTPSVNHVYKQVWRIVTNVQQRLSQAAFTNGYVQTPKVTVQIPSANWTGTNFFGQAQISNNLPVTTVRAVLSPHAPVALELSNSDFGAILVVTNEPTAVVMSGLSRWRTNQFTLFAGFGTDGILPEIARVNASSIVVPHVKGDLAFVWERNAYSVEAKGILLDQPVSFRARATGNTNSARVEAAELTSPWGYASVEGDVTFANLQHHGSALVRNVTVPGLNHFDVAVDWFGEKLNLTNVFATARAASSTTVFTSGATDLKEKRFQITALEFGTNRLDFAADIHWPHSGHICTYLTNFSGELFSGFLDLPDRDVLLEKLGFTTGWTNGPLTGDVDFAGRTILADGTRLGAEGSLAVHSNGVTLTNLTFTRNSASVSSAYGSLPISINVTNKPFITAVTNGRLHLQANADPKAFFWSLLATNAGVTLREPEVRGEIYGTWDKPVGRVQARAAEIKFRNSPPTVPAIESLSLVAHFRKEAAEVEFFNFFVTNQPITFSGLMPLPENFWSAPRTNMAKLNWRDLSCRLRIDSAQIAAFVPLLPRLIAPQGVIDADLGLEPGGKLNGQVRIDGAGTRPIESLGSLQDVEILCRLQDDKAQVSSYVALGGYSVLGGGQVWLDLNRLLRREQPSFEFHVTGENVPLTRQADALVRADIDITLRRTNEQPVLIAGKLNLRDSLYLRELRELIPGKLASPEMRPPYFAVARQPFANWRLDLRATGHRFLKVRTPVFNGEVSADLKLFGTLGDPVATGDLLINAGRVRFPFGNISINQGIISLTSDNPYRPQVLVTGNDRVLGYDINLDLSGYADAPVLQFTSTPPLNSDQVLLMLTAGEVPRQGQINFSTEERAQRLALFLGRGMLSDLGIGGDSNRLTVRSGENVSETGRPTYSVEYELTEDWSVIGQYDRFNDFNLMLKWRVYSR